MSIKTKFYAFCLTNKIRVRNLFLTSSTDLKNPPPSPFQRLNKLFTGKTKVVETFYACTQYNFFLKKHFTTSCIVYTAQYYWH